MFSAHVLKLTAYCESLKRAVCVNNTLRTAAFGDVAEHEKNPILVAVAAACPSRVDWQLFDHCAGVTRLYALYEQFIVDLVTAYVDQLPSFYPIYSGLPEPTQKQHRVGVGQLLHKWSDSGLYGHLTEDAIAAGLADGLRGSRGYRLLSDAFLIDAENYRPTALIRLFGYLDFQDCLSYVRKHPRLQAFMAASGDTTETLDSILTTIVQLRNEAAHGTVSHVVSTSELLRLTDFILLLCGALADMLERRALSLAIGAGHYHEVAEVIHAFSDCIFGVKCRRGSIHTGERLIARTSGSAKPVAVLSIEVNRTQVATAATEENQEIGVKLSDKVPVGAPLFRLNPPTNVSPADDFMI